MPSTKMKEYIMHKLFELPSYTPIRVFQRRSTSASVGDTPSSEWFDHILDEAHPLPEGLVMVSPVMTHAAFQSPTPPSPPGTPTRPTRSFSLDTHLSKGTRWAAVNGLQQRIRARLTWTRRRSADDASLHHDADSDDDTGVIVPSVIIETVHGEKHQKTSANASTLEFYDATTSISSPPLDAISEEDDGKKHITFSMAPMVRHMYFAVESYEEWVIRVSNGYASCDSRPAHVKLHAFCNKSLTYLKYRESPCVEVFALGAHDISMWRTLGHHNWTRDAVPAPHEEMMQHQDNDDAIDEYTKDGRASPTSPLTDDEEENDPHSCSDRDDDDEDDVQVELERVPVVPQNTDLQPLLDVINATVGKGDKLFTLADMMHFCCELEYPTRDGREEDGWC
ncbi:hypothetical protein SPRG_04356 [Saprolegnia parasitica CBS 223.65]|uniref:Uncharacterized protein n=1 Tax=Saprolegnia parasitica (strain CBS 223.65) TaxID=695850 RepID=A0A067CI77_SAPPC|nr:hypothetical protein SPRG_04356 [Saprolegnia parasitica CBS 223.65]KDO30454.1 hypothetical protein SPRG_04356 [Saprolegnia parasitica CBS 223.65]|eukprot:XP_012198676.1 hypothetical protein SPRG_04356 [Saprolegnia parasitica CBS 223.65]